MYGPPSAGENDWYACPAPFNRPLNLIMDVAMGGRFEGPPDKTKKYPIGMLVDDVRVDDEPGGCGEEPKRVPVMRPFCR